MRGERLLITGTSGYLGRAILDRAAVSAAALGVEIVAPNRSSEPRCDLDDPDRLARFVRELAPDRILHVAAEARMSACEADPEGAFRRNCEATAALAGEASRICFVSTDLVFDGSRAPYRPTDATSPLSVYGHSKAGAESEVVSRQGLVVRIPLLFGPSFDGRRGATDMLRAAAREGRSLSLFSNEFRTPIHVVDAAAALLAAVASERRGIEHLAGPERVSRAELARRFVAQHPIRLEFTEVESEDPTRPRDVSLVGGSRVSRSLDEMLVAC